MKTVIKILAICVVGVTCSAWKNEEDFDRICRNSYTGQFSKAINAELSADDAALLCSCMRDKISEATDGGDALEDDFLRMLRGLPPVHLLSNVAIPNLNGMCSIFLANGAIRHETPEARAASQKATRQQNVEGLRETCNVVAAGRRQGRPNQTGMIMPDDEFNASAYDKQCAELGIQLPPFSPR